MIKWLLVCLVAMVIAATGLILKPERQEGERLTRHLIQASDDEEPQRYVYNVRRDGKLIRTVIEYE